MRKKIHQMLENLRLKGMAEVLDEELDLAEKKGTPTCEVISRLLAKEHSCRQQRSLDYRINKAKLPWDWSLKTFPFDKQPGVNKAQIRSLAE